MEHQYNLRNPAVKRLMKEAQELHESTELFYAQPLEDDLFEWHFTIRGPEDTEFANGIYHGKIVLPPEYPMKPPSIILLTPNGRFEMFKKICLSISGHHPESWQPSWSIRTALLAIIGFMPTHGNGAIGSLDYSPEERKKLAKSSLDWECPDCGAIHRFLKPLTEASSSGVAEAKELAKQINFQADNTAQVKSIANEKKSQNTDTPEASKEITTTSIETITTSVTTSVSLPTSNSYQFCNMNGSSHMPHPPFHEGFNQQWARMPMMAPPAIPHPMFTMMMMQAQYNAYIHSLPGYMSGSPFYQNSSSVTSPISQQSTVDSTVNSCSHNTSADTFNSEISTATLNPSSFSISSSQPCTNSLSTSNSNNVSQDNLLETNSSQCDNITPHTSDFDENTCTNSLSEEPNSVNSIDAEESAIPLSSVTSLDSNVPFNSQPSTSSTNMSENTHDNSSIDNSSHLRQRYVYHEHNELNDSAELPVNIDESYSSYTKTNFIMVLLAFCIIMLLVRRFVSDNIIRI